MAFLAQDPGPLRTITQSMFAQILSSQLVATGFVAYKVSDSLTMLVPPQPLMATPDIAMSPITRVDFEILLPQTTLSFDMLLSYCWHNI